MLVRILLGLCGAFCIVLVAASLLLLTSGGSRYLVGLVVSATDLEIEYGSGKPFTGLQLERLAIETDLATIVLRDIEARAEAACLLRASVCLEYLQVADIEITVHEESAESADGDPPLWPLPFPVASERIQLERLRVAWLSGSLTSGRVDASARVYGEQVHLRSARANTVLLVVNEDADIENDEQESVVAPTILPEVDLPLDLLVDELALSDSAWLIHGLRNEYNELNVAGRWRGNLLELRSLSLANHEWGRASLHGDIEFLHPYTINASGQYQAAKPQLWQGLHESRGQVTAHGDLAALSLEVDQCGSINAHVSALVDLLGTGLPLRLEAKGGCSATNTVAPLLLNTLPGLEAWPDLVLGSDWAVTLTGNQGAQTIALDTALSSYGQELRMAAELFHHDQQLVINRLHVSPVDDASQHLGVSGTLSYAQDLIWDLSLLLDSVAFPEQWVPLPGSMSGTSTAKGVLKEGHWALSLEELDLVGQVSERPVTITGQLQLDSALETDGTAIELRSAADVLRLSDVKATEPQAHFSVVDLGAWLEGAQGELAGTLNWSREAGTVTASGEAAGVSWGAMRARQLSWTADIETTDEINGQVQATLNHALIGDSRLQQVQFSLQGSEADHRLDLELKGDFAASANLSGGFGEAGWRGELEPMSLQTGLGTWALGEAVSLTYSAEDQQLSLADHCWRGEVASLCASEALLGYSGALVLDVAGALQDFDDLLPQRYKIAGELTGSMQARWRDLEPEQFSASFRLGEGSLTESLLGTQRAHYDWDSLTLDYAGGAAEGRLWGQLTRNGEAQLALDLSMPVALNGQLSGGFEVSQFELGELQPFVSVVNSLGGTAEGSIRFGGTVGDPDIKGALTLREGEFSITGNPTQVEAVSLTVDFQGDHADIRGGLAIGDGRSDVAGNLSWVAEPALALNLRGNSKPLLYPTDTVVYAAEDLQLRIDDSGISLQGDVAVMGGDIVLDDIPETAVEVSEDVVLLDYAGQEAQVAVSSPVSLNVAVSIEQPLSFRTEGVQADLVGDLVVARGGTEPLLVQGKLNVPQGQFDLLGPRFDVTRGQIAFVGAPDNPELDLAMEREITEDQVTVGIRVTGNVQLPRLEFYSRPALPEAEVMAYALSGRGVDRSGAGDGLGLAMAMTSSLMQSTGVLSGLSLGVEGKDNSTRAVVGGYVSERIYMSYGVGLYEPVNTLTVRLDILHNFWMEVVSSLRSSADVYYSWSTR